MNPFKILGIDSTASIREIKQAYAAKLKIHRPDDDSIKFQAINTAYQAAIEYANRKVTVSVRPPVPFITSRDETGTKLPSDTVNKKQVNQDDLTPRHIRNEANNNVQNEASPISNNQFVAADFFAEFSKVASSDPIGISRWLQNHPALFSIELKDRLCEHVVSHLEASPSLRPQALKDIFHFFNLDTVNDNFKWLSPRLEQLNERARMENPWEDLSFINTSRPRASQTNSSDSQIPWQIIFIGLLLASTILRNIG